MARPSQSAPPRLYPDGGSRLRAARSSGARALASPVLPHTSTRRTPSAASRDACSAVASRRRAPDSSKRVTRATPTPPKGTAILPDYRDQCPFRAWGHDYRHSPGAGPGSRRGRRRAHHSEAWRKRRHGRAGVRTASGLPIAWHFPTPRPPWGSRRGRVSALVSRSPLPQAHWPSRRGQSLAECNLLNVWRHHCARASPPGDERRRPAPAACSRPHCGPR